MKRRLITFVIVLTVLLTACAPEEHPPQPTSPTTSPTELPTTPASTPTPEPAKAKPEQDAAITAVSNHAEARSTAQDEYVAAEAGMVVLVSGGVQTFEEGRASLNLRPEETIIRIGPNTIFTLQELSEEGQPSTRIQLDLGQIWILLNGGSLEVETPSGMASVRGSLLGVSYDPATQRMDASCLEGECGLWNDSGHVDFADGQRSFIEGGYGPADVEFMDEHALQEWVNENPDYFEHFDGEQPEWLPRPELDWLQQNGEYFLPDGESPLMGVYFDEDGTLLDRYFDKDGNLLDYDGTILDREEPPPDGDRTIPGEPPDGNNGGFDGPPDGGGEGLPDEPPDLPDEPPDLPDDPPDLPDDPPDLSGDGPLPGQ